MEADNSSLKRHRAKGSMKENGIKSIDDKLESLKRYFEREIISKEELLRRTQEETMRLKTVLSKKEAGIISLEIRIRECSQKEEGNRQLINKLLNDIQRYQNDIEWYKRTYEKRSLIGILKDKLLK